MNSTKQNASQEYKACGGKGCSQRGIHYLKIRFINRHGWFCDSCKDVLVYDKLADTTIDCGD